MQKKILKRRKKEEEGEWKIFQLRQQQQIGQTIHLFQTCLTGVYPIKHDIVSLVFSENQAGTNPFASLARTSQGAV